MERIDHRAMKREGDLSGWLWQDNFEHVQQHHDVFFLESKTFKKVYFSCCIREVVMGVDAYYKVVVTKKSRKRMMRC